MFYLRLASTVFHHFLAADDASESFTGLKRIHGYMPYFMLKAALKISNPVAMIRSAHLFSRHLHGEVNLSSCSRPLPGSTVRGPKFASTVRRLVIILAQSLIVRSMFTSSLNEEVKSLEEDIEAVKDKVDDPVICEKVRQFVYGPKEIQAMYKSDAGIVIQ
jgi:Domain of unknown function in PX-proteins (DUF3818)